LDVVRLLQAWVCGWKSVDDIVRASDLTAWQTHGVVTLELDADVRGSALSYRVEFDCSRELGKSRVQQEQLREGERTLILRDKDGVQLHKDSGEKGGRFPLSWSQSAIAAVEPSHVNTKLQGFRDFIAGIVVLRPLPPLFEKESRAEADRPDIALGNIVSWYRRLMSNQKTLVTLRDLLKTVWPDFDYVQLEESGRDAKLMQLVFEQTGSLRSTVTLNMGQLSDGERMLLALYLLAAYQQTNEHPVILVDEPDNFVGLAEIQPWLEQMLDTRPADGQLIVVSHSPEAIATMGEKRVALFSRAGHSAPTQVRRVPPDETGLPLAERIARGWIDA
jgi:hypothetical protein